MNFKEGELMAEEHKERGDQLMNHKRDHQNGTLGSGLHTQSLEKNHLDPNNL